MVSCCCTDKMVLLMYRKKILDITNLCFPMSVPVSTSNACMRLGVNVEVVFYVCLCVQVCLGFCVYVCACVCVFN